MGYCTETQVQEEFKGLDLTASGQAVTTAKVTRFIAEADAEIDSKVGMVYTTPITGANSLIVMRSISIALVADRIRAIMEVKTAPQSTSQGGRRDGNAAWARDLLDKIVSGRAILSDATKISSGDGVSAYAVNAGLEHTLEKGTDQW